MNERRKGDRRVPPAVAQHLVEERGELLAMVESLRALAQECSEYLNVSQWTSIASGSALHRKLSAASLRETKP